MVISCASRKSFLMSSKSKGTYAKSFADPSRTNAIAQAGNYVDPPKYYEHLLNKWTIHFSDRNAPETEEFHFTLELNKKMSYDQLAAKVAEHLKVDPTHVRFTTVTAANGRPRSVVKKANNQTLTSILNPQYQSFSTSAAGQRGDWLFYEILELSLSELETMKNIKITLLNEGITKEVCLFNCAIYASMCCYSLTVV